MIEVPYVKDLRKEGDQSFQAVPFLSTFDELVTKFHLNVRRDKGWEATPKDQFCFKLIGFNIHIGPAAYLPQVLDLQGKSFPKVEVIRTWPSAPAFTDTVIPLYASNGVIGETNDLGEVGFPYAPTSGLGDNGGPDMIWVKGDEDIPYSDAVEKLGWYLGTDHLTADPIYQLTLKEGSQEEPVEDVYELRVVVKGVVVGTIKIDPSVDVPEAESWLALFKGNTELGRAIISKI